MGLMQCPNFNSLRVVSFSAAIMSLSYSTIAIGGAIAIGKQPNAYYNLDRFSTADKVLRSILLCTASQLLTRCFAQSYFAQLICTNKKVFAAALLLSIKSHGGRLQAVAGEAGRMPGLTLCMVLPQVFNIFNALGTIAFAYGGHNVVSVWCSL